MPAAPSNPPRLSQDPAYGPTFWLCYLANTLLMVAVSILFRYADFIFHLGGTEMQLGLIVGIGMVGALAIRVVQGVGIDRFGPRLIWLLSLVLFVISCLGHLPITSVNGPAVYLVRIMMTISIAGAFGASLTYISLRVPENRVAEIVGTLGSSGFVGLALGPTMGDLLFGGGESTHGEIQRMFWLAAAIGSVSLLFTALATRGHLQRPPRRQPPILGLLFRYHPGAILLVAIAMGLGVGLPNVFLRAYTAHLGLPGIKTFFLVYAATAFSVRIATRRWSDQLGVRPVILLGLSCLAASMLLYLPVRTEWHLAAPAVLAGTAHAFLFPAVVAGGSLSFPARYRGLATTLTLAMFDMGNLIGQPAVGGILHTARQFQLPPYATMFLLVSLTLAGIAAYYAVRGSTAGLTRRDRAVARREAVAALRRDGGRCAA